MDLHKGDKDHRGHLCVMENCPPAKRRQRVSLLPKLGASPHFRSDESCGSVTPEFAAFPKTTVTVNDTAAANTANKGPATMDDDESAVDMKFSILSQAQPYRRPARTQARAQHKVWSRINVCLRDKRCPKPRGHTGGCRLNCQPHGNCRLLPNHPGPCEKRKARDSPTVRRASESGRRAAGLAHKARRKVRLPLAWRTATALSTSNLTTTAPTTIAPAPATTATTTPVPATPPEFLKTLSPAQLQEVCKEAVKMPDFMTTLSPSQLQEVCKEAVKMPDFMTTLSPSQREELYEEAVRRMDPWTSRCHDCQRMRPTVKCKSCARIYHTYCLLNTGLYSGICKFCVGHLYTTSAMLGLRFSVESVTRMAAAAPATTDAPVSS